MDINVIRTVTTLALFVFFIILIVLVYNRKGKKYYDEAANLPFDDGDERSQQINEVKTKVEDHE